MKEKPQNRSNARDHLKSNRIDDFNESLEGLVISQAKRMIDLSLYTKSLLSTVPVALIGMDKNGSIRNVNRAAEEILEVSESKIKDQHLESLFDTNSPIPAKAHQALSDGRPQHMSSENLHLSSGKKIVGNLYMQPLRDDEQEICGLLLTIEDQTYVHFLNDAFKRYVPPSVSEIIANDPKSLELGGEIKTLTVLFSDLEGFTSISEQFDPKEMVTLLSDYFSEMTQKIFVYEGTLKEYVGDELMAIFGAPIKQNDHEERACDAALAMRQRLSEMRREWEGRGRPRLRARTGINTGPMLVGNLGSPYRFSYGAMGDHVNLASRLEGLCKIYGVDIIVSENTVQSVKGRFVFRELDMVRVKGRMRPVKLFELVSRKNETLTHAVDACLAQYESGLKYYRSQNWNLAIQSFEKALACSPEDKPSKMMMARCRDYLETPPGKDWDGVYQHTRK